MKHLIREIEPEYAELGFYFDGDTFTSRAGDFCYTLFIVVNKGYGRLSGLNIDEYEEIKQRAEELIDSFDCIEKGYDYYGETTFKNVMELSHIPYNSTKCGKLRKWAADADIDKPEDIAAFLSITTGHKWTTTSATGYCQGDYAEIIYCPEFYPNGVDAEGDIFLGCAKEFSVTDYENDDDTEGYTTYGYIVADCQARTDEDYKRIVCDWAGINPEDTTLEMIDGCSTRTVYSYRTV